MSWSIVHVVLIVLLASTMVLAALPPVPPEQLRADATDIVVGQVTQAYSAERTKDADYSDTLWLFEVVPATVEKGDATKAGQVLYVKAWRPAKRPRGWAGPQGQNVLPKVGQTVRMYLRREADGSFSAMTPNGIEVVGEK